MSYDLNGTTQYFTGPISPINVAEGTFCGWFAPDFAPAGTTQYYFWATTTWVFSFRKYTDTNKCIVVVDGRQSVSTVTGMWTSGSWNHFTVTYKKDGSIIQLYVNGVAAAMAAQTGVWGVTTPTALKLGVYNNGSTSPFDGRVCDFAIYNKMLVDANIMRLANGERPGAVSLENLTGYWPLAKDTTSAISGTTSLTAVGAPTIAANPIELKTHLSAFQIMQKCYDPAAKALRIV